MQTYPLLAFITLSAAQSSAQTRIHSAILVTDTPNNASYIQVHWLVRTPYLTIKASNDPSLKYKNVCVYVCVCVCVCEQLPTES